MHLNILALVSILTIFLSSGALSNNSTYRAAVYEHIPKFKTAENLNYYWYTAKYAAQNGAKIVVFPESGIIMYFSRKRSDLRSILPEHSKLKIGSNPCVDRASVTSKMETIISLSCISKDHNIVTVTNFGSSETCTKEDPDCPQDGFYLYNTNFAFDSDGKLLGTQRKYHLFSEPYFNRPKQPDETVFETSFGVRFGMMACFDIIFDSATKLVTKYNVTNIVYPTYWFDGYPFYVSLEIQERFARGLDINLLASNVHVPSIGSFGSGIYAGKHGHLAYTYSTYKSSKILYADVPVGRTNVQPKVAKPVARSLGFHRMFDDDFKGYTFKELGEQKGSITAENNGVTCNIEYEFGKKFGKQKHYLAAFNGSHHTHNNKHHWGVEVCALLVCDATAIVCDAISTISYNKYLHFKLTGKFSVNQLFPGVLLSGFRLPESDDWTITPEKIESKKTPTDPLIVAVIIGRNYKIDIP